MPLEEEMRASVAAGNRVDRGEGPFDLAEMQAWAADRTVRAAVLRHLLVGNEWPVGASGVRLRGVRISGCLDLDATTIGCTLYLDGCYIDADEPVCLDHATASLVALTGCQLPGMTADMLTARNLDLSRSTFTGPVWMFGVDIAGRLSCRDAQLAGRDNDGCALFAQAIRAGAGVFLDGDFTTTTGGVRLVSADMGQLSCRDAQLAGRDNDGYALLCEAITAGAGVFCDQKFTTTTGGVRLLSADIGQLSCRDAQLAGRDNDGCALLAKGMKAHRDVFLNGEFTAGGTVSLESAQVSGSVDLRPTGLATGEDVISLDATGTQIAGALRWAPARQVSGRVILEGATVGELADDWASERGQANGYWPTGARLRLVGFSYGRLSGVHQATVNERLAWIRSQYKPKPAVPRKDTPAPPETASAHDGVAGFASQPYEQLAAVYRRAGQDTEARKVAIARRADLRKYGDLNWYRTAGNWLLDKTIKYGYQSWRVGVGLAAVFVVVWALSVVAQHLHLIVPVGNIEGLHYVPSVTNCTSGYPCFYPAGYAVDTVIPIINVHQAEYWGLNGHAPWGWAWVAGTWIATGLGWALATLLVAGYTGLVRQD